MKFNSPISQALIGNQAKVVSSTGKLVQVCTNLPVLLTKVRMSAFNG